MSKLLLNEQPLLVMPQLAKKIGLNESLVLQQIHYWLEINKKVNNNLRDGHYWTFNSYEQWQDQFPFWSVKTIQRTINNLESLKLVVSGNYNKLRIDRTKWYRVDYEALQTLETSPFGHIDQTNRTEWLDHLDNLTKAIPETNSETKPEINYLHLCEMHNPYIDKYLEVINRSGIEQKKVSPINYRYIENKIKDFYYLPIDDFETLVEEYLKEVKSDGDILYFLKTYKRCI